MTAPAFPLKAGCPLVLPRFRVGDYTYNGSGYYRPWLPFDWAGVPVAADPALPVWPPVQQAGQPVLAFRAVYFWGCGYTLPLTMADYFARKAVTPVLDYNPTLPFGFDSSYVPFLFGTLPVMGFGYVSSSGDLQIPVAAYSLYPDRFVAGEVLNLVNTKQFSDANADPYFTHDGGGSQIAQSALIANDIAQFNAAKDRYTRVQSIFFRIDTNVDDSNTVVKSTIASIVAGVDGTLVTAHYDFPPEVSGGFIDAQSVLDPLLPGYITAFFGA